ncbi:MAG TPA: hypothetical protein VM597_21215 [Gemmataceae bacterium]|nr:hypothetical protein [Gemmataceae bacterium]
MLRTLFALTAASAAVAAPAPKAKEKDPVYFTTRLDDKREYEVRSGDKVESTYTDLVTQVEKADGALHVTITRDYPGSRAFVTVIAVSAEGLHRVSSNGKALDTPIQLFKAPPKVGATWKWGAMTYGIVGEEEVDVPGGKYKAFKVESSGGGDSKTVQWFAPGIGLVKQSETGSDTTIVLKAFTPGK